jgi:hypothetical protein
MLPNATRLYTRTDELEYVTDLLHGEVTVDDRSYEIEAITALTEEAFRNPLIPIGSSGVLNFKSGDLTIPAYSDFELYLGEISAKWLKDGLGSGFLRTLTADQEEINTYAMNGEKVPEGQVLEALIDGGISESGCHLYWVGPDPQEIVEPDKTLILLIIDEEEDQVDAYRTTAAMLAANEEPKDVSLYLYRDSKADRMEEEKYNIFWFDTPEGEESIVKVITNVLSPRTLETPRPIHITLRGQKNADADLPAYSLSDHMFLLSDGNGGDISLFDGFYQASFDGDIFESSYTKIEGIRDGQPVVTVKENQPVWPEVTGDETAEDIGGRSYRLINSQWQEESDT